MSKLGKLFGPVVLVFAIASLVIGYLLFKETMRYRGHTARLAGTMVDTAQKLDSGSKDSEKVTFTAPAKGAKGKEAKEQGSIGYESFKDAPNDYDEALKTFSGLTERVLAQRNDLAGKLVQVAKKIECPAAQLPNQEKLNDLNGYAKGADALLAFAGSRVQRDRNLQNAINDMFSKVGMKNRYSGKITANGALDKADADAFNAVKQTFDAQKAAAEKKAKELQNKINTANSEVKKCTTKISQLEKQLTEAQEVIKAKEAEVAKIKARAQKAEKYLTEYFMKGLAIPELNQKEEPAISLEQVESSLCGQIVQVDKKTGLVALNLSQGKVAVGLRMSVHRGKKIVGMIRIESVNPYNSVAIIEDGDVQVGDNVLVASKKLREANF